MSKWTEDHKPQITWGSWAFAAGIAVTCIAGFGWGGWYTSSGAQKLATETAQTAVEDALTPVCVSQFLGQPNASVQLAALKSKQSYERSEMVGKTVKIPGQASLPYGVSDACAQKIIASTEHAKK